MLKKMDMKPTAQASIIDNQQIPEYNLGSALQENKEID